METSSDSYEAFLTRKIAELKLELSAAESSLAELQRHRPPLNSSKVPAHEPKTLVEPRNSAVTEDAYLTDAIVELLEAQRKPLRLGAIWDLLYEKGCRPVADNPKQAIRDALKKREKIYRDIIRVAYGTWALRSWYTDEQLSEIKEKNAGLGGHSKLEHSKATKKGMQKLAAKGVPLGRPSKITVEMVRKIRELAAQGCTKKLICETVGISRGSLQNYWKQIIAWREGDSWPPPEHRLIENEGLRLISK